jgi:arsenate reductase
MEMMAPGNRTILISSGFEERRFPCAGTVVGGLLLKQMRSFDLLRTQRVLILCNGNSDRSLMAAALLRIKGVGVFEVFGAGTLDDGVNPLAIEVMQEIGIDISRQKFKNIEDFRHQAFDIVITISNRAEESFPIFPRAQMFQWILPAPQEIWDYRKTRYEIAARVDSFLKRERHSLLERVHSVGYRS